MLYFKSARLRTDVDVDTRFAKINMAVRGKFKILQVIINRCETRTGITKKANNCKQSS